MGVTVDLTGGQTAFGDGSDADGDTISNFESIIGSEFNDILTGNNGFNVLDGGGDDDVLDGGGGGDILIGGAGDDMLTGGGGGDTFIFGSSDGIDDIVDFSGVGMETDRIDLVQTELCWGDLDTNGNNVLDEDDNFVLVPGGDTVIDLGAAAEDGMGDPGLNTVTVVGVVGLVEQDFAFDLMCGI